MARILLLVPQFPVSRPSQVIFIVDFVLNLQMIRTGLGSESSDCTLFPTCRKHVEFCTHLGVSVCPYESVPPNAGSWQSLASKVLLQTQSHKQDVQAIFHKLEHHHFFHKRATYFTNSLCEKSGNTVVATFITNSSSKELGRSRTFCVVYASMVPKNYDYRRLKAWITLTAKKRYL